MLLGAYLADQGLLPINDPAASAFSAIRAFLFGEEYTVELVLDDVVSSYRFPTLTDALGVLRSEFSVDDRFIPQIGIVDYKSTRNRKFGEIAKQVGAERSGYRPEEMKTDRKAHLRQAFNINVANQVPTFGAAPDRVLAVTRAERNVNFPMPGIDFYIEDIEKAVTFYSLTGTWDQMGDRSNL
jgi:hypothetical protein